MAEEDHHVAGQGVEVGVRLFFTPLVEWIIRIVSAEMANLLRQGVVAEVIDKSKSACFRCVVCQVEGGIDAKRSQCVASFIGSVPVLAEILVPFLSIGSRVNMRPKAAQLALSTQHGLEIRSYRIMTNQCSRQLRLLF